MKLQDVVEWNQNTNKWKDIPCSWIRRLDIVKRAVLPSGSLGVSVQLQEAPSGSTSQPALWERGTKGVPVLPGLREWVLACKPSKVNPMSIGRCLVKLVSLMCERRGSTVFSTRLLSAYNLALRFASLQPCASHSSSLCPCLWNGNKNIFFAGLS